MPDPAYAFSLAAQPQALVTRLIRELGDFTHLREARIVCVRSEPALMLKGQKVNAFIGRVRCSGTSGPLLSYLLWAFCADVCGAEEPEFLIVFDGAIWDGLDDEHRERLVFHELSHLVQQLDEDDCPKEDKDGRPVLAVVFHDYEFFDAEVRRYGPETCALVGAAVAIADGHRAAGARELKLRRRSA